MKNLYHHNKNKGKVHPSPSSSSSSATGVAVAVFPTNNRDALSALSLLPAAILALASLLSVEDREVLSYLITRSINTNTTNPPSSIQQENKKKCKKSNHKHPLFDCGCFDCYTSYWFRWDSSPNRELINQAIEAFEEYLTKGEQYSSTKTNIRGAGKKKDKMGHHHHRRLIVKDLESPEKLVPMLQDPVSVLEKSFVLPENEVFPLTHELIEEDEEYVEVVKEEDEVMGKLVAEEEEAMNDGDLTLMVVQSPPSSAENHHHHHHHKGLARKVLPDVLGLFSSRLWSLWSPNA